MIPKEKLVQRFEAFGRGEWASLIEASRRCDEEAAVSRRRRRRRGYDELERRAARAEMLVGLGELSSARQALEGADLAPGTENTRRLLSDRNKRPPELLDPIPVEVANHVPPVPFALDEDRFYKNLRVAKRGAAGGPSGMTAEHLRPLMDSPPRHEVVLQVGGEVGTGGSS